MAACGTRSTRPCKAMSQGSPSIRPVSRCQAMSSATSASSSAGTYQSAAAGELLQPEVGARFELHDVDVLLQQRDERQEQRAVEPVGVKLGRRHIGGRDQHHAQFEQPREQPAEDHGVGDVGDVEFVEAEQPGLAGDLLGGKPDRRRRRRSRRV